MYLSMTTENSKFVTEFLRMRVQGVVEAPPAKPAAINPLAFLNDYCAEEDAPKSEH